MAGPFTVRAALDAGRELFAKCLAALFRALALAFLVGLHAGINSLARRLLTHDLPRLEWLLVVIFAGGFVSVYVYQVGEMVGIFIPAFAWPGKKQNRSGKER